MPLSKCTISQAMSALVKHVRVRRPADAVYWFNHVARCFPEETFRLYRRLLVCAAEDCIEVPVQMTAYDWYKRALSSKDFEDVVGSGSYLINLICSTKNWWAQPSGQQYILAWRLADKKMRATEFDPAITAIDEFHQLGKYVTQGDTLMALMTHMRMTKLKINKGAYALWLKDQALANANLPARLVAQVHLSNQKLMGFDDNWLGQSLWRLLGNPLGTSEFVEPDDEQVHQMLVQSIAEVWENSRTPPAWTQDGIHCSGKDTRFAGILSSMVGCCNMFNSDGELNPDTPWDDTTRSTERLMKHVQDSNK